MWWTIGGFYHLIQGLQASAGGVTGAGATHGQKEQW